MKLAMTLLVTGLLLVTASAVSAADNDSAQAPAVAVAAAAQAAPTLVVGESLVSNLTGNCGDQQITAGIPEPTEMGYLSCGSCSTGGCAGATRGQICWLGSGWGNCNIYSGGFRCSTGGWECQCGSGPLP